MNVFCEHGKIVTRCKICSKNNIIAQNNPPAPKIAAEDRNLAFKCNWMDTDYEKPCGSAGRKWNIYVKKSIWCTQPENPCYQFERGLRNDTPEFPCYESGIFRKSEFGAGVNHTGPKKGEGRKIKFITPGKLAIFTTVEPEKPESERHIFGFFVIKDHYIDDEGATRIVGYRKYTLKIPKDSRLMFWDFYRNADGSISWKTGLFRYLNDTVVVGYLKRQHGILLDNGHRTEAETVEEILTTFYKKAWG